MGKSGRLSKIMQKVGGLNKIKPFMDSMVEMNKLYKGKLDVAFLTVAYSGALQKLKEKGVKHFVVEDYAGKHKVKIDMHEKEILKFIKRGIIIDLKNRDMLDKYLNSEKLVNKTQEELLKELEEVDNG